MECYPLHEVIGWWWTNTFQSFSPRTPRKMTVADVTWGYREIRKPQKILNKDAGSPIKRPTNTKSNNNVDQNIHLRLYHFRSSRSSERAFEAIRKIRRESKESSRNQEERNHVRWWGWYRWWKWNGWNSIVRDCQCIEDRWQYVFCSKLVQITSHLLYTATAVVVVVFNSVTLSNRSSISSINIRILFYFIIRSAYGFNNSNVYTNYITFNI